MVVWKKKILIIARFQNKIWMVHSATLTQCHVKISLFHMKKTCSTVPFKFHVDSLVSHQRNFMVDFVSPLIHFTTHHLHLKLSTPSSTFATKLHCCYHQCYCNWPWISTIQCLGMTRKLSVQKKVSLDPWIRFFWTWTNKCNVRIWFIVLEFFL